MVERVPLVNSGGIIQQLPPGDFVTGVVDEISSPVIWFDNLTSTPLSPAAIGGGTAQSSASVATPAIVGSRVGVVGFVSNAGADTGYSVALPANTQLYLVSPLLFQVAFYIPTASLSSTSLRIGFGALFSNTDNTNEQVLRILAGSAFGRSASTVPSTVSQNTSTSYSLSGNTWYIGEIQFNSNGTAVTFRIKATRNGAALWEETMSLANYINQTLSQPPLISGTSTTATSKTIALFDWLKLSTAISR